MNMRKLALLLLAAAASSLAAMPTKQELKQVEGLVQELMRPEAEAMKAGKKNRADVAKAAVVLAEKAESDAAKLLLLKGSFTLYVGHGAFDEAIDVLRTIRTTIPDVSPQHVANMVESALRNIPKNRGGQLYRILDDAKARVRHQDALKAALDAAKAEGLEHYMVDGGYRTWDEQNTFFQNKMTKLSSKYTGDALIAATKKEVNYPGTSEYNSGLGFDLRLYDKNDPDVATPKYSTTAQGKWMNENCWKYGIVFRFPQAGWPLETSTDKSFKTGVSMHLNLYRYVGKGNAAIMHYMDFTMEEYIEYLEEHPHIALFEDGVLKYEVYRQPVGDAFSFDVQLTRNAPRYQSSLDNMGAVITVFEY